MRVWLALALGAAALAVLCFGLNTWGGPLSLPAQALDWQPGLALSEPWRALTAAFVHLSLKHLLANLAGCAALALLGWAASLPRRAAGAWLAAWPLTQLGLWLRPDLLHYGGLSGVLHAGVAVLCVQLWLRGGRERRIGIALLLGLTGKLLLEAPWGPALQAHEGWDIAIAPFAHLSGAVAGLLCAAVGLRRARNTACPDVFTSKQGGSRPPN